MSVSVTTINIVDNATPSVSAKLADMSPQKLASRVGEPMRIFWRDRLKSLGRNKRGWPSTGFWESAARATRSTVVPTGLLLECTKVGVRQRYLGGHIKPVKARALTIPISPVSYGHSPSEFPGLFLIKTAKGAYLVQSQGIDTTTKKAFIGGRKALGGNASRRLRATLNFLFKLSSGVDQEADPSVVPTVDEFTEVAFAVIVKEARN